MDPYHVALFIHIVTLIVAVYATAVTKVAVGRRGIARTVGDALDWHGILMSTSKLFPVCLAAFTITGAYMLSLARPSVWSSGFVVAGLTGVVFLLASGVFLAVKGKALQQVLEGIAQRGLDQPAPKLMPPPIVAALPAINTGVAVGVVFDMVTKPSSIPLALMVVVFGILLGATAYLRRPTPLGDVVSARVQADSQTM
jgi:hypothetical protein